MTKFDEDIYMLGFFFLQDIEMSRNIQTIGFEYIASIT